MAANVLKSLRAIHPVLDEALMGLEGATAKKWKKQIEVAAALIRQAKDLPFLELFLLGTLLQNFR